jgi:hypothetical protein
LTNSGSCYILVSQIGEIVEIRLLTCSSLLTDEMRWRKEFKMKKLRTVSFKLTIFIIVLSTIASFIGIAGVVQADFTASSEVKLTASDAMTGDLFGSSVSVSGDTVVVGASKKDSNSGVAYVFVRSGSSWIQQAKLTSSDIAIDDWFGDSVVVSGDTIVVGAPGKDSVRGAAYIFVRSGTIWSQQAKLTPSDAADNDRFGGSVAISGDTVVVGASLKNSATGAACVFVRSGSNWIQQAKLNASDITDGDWFGESVSISGATIIVGAPGKNSNGGVVYVFVRSGTSWD